MQRLRDGIATCLDKIRLLGVSRQSRMLLTVMADATPYPYWLWYAEPIGRQLHESQFIGGYGTPDDDLCWLPQRVQHVPKVELDRRIVQPFIAWVSEFRGMLRELERLVGGSETIPPTNGFDSNGKFYWHNIEVQAIAFSPEERKILERLLKSRFLTAQQIAILLEWEDTSPIKTRISRFRKKLEGLSPSLKIIFQQSGAASGYALKSEEEASVTGL